MNNKVFEPEFRIVLVLFQLIGAAVGLFPFGYSVDQHWSYYISILLFAFVTFALIIGDGDIYCRCAFGYGGGGLFMYHAV